MMNSKFRKEYRKNMIKSRLYFCKEMIKTLDKLKVKTESKDDLDFINKELELFKEDVEWFKKDIEYFKKDSK